MVHSQFCLCLVSVFFYLAGKIHSQVLEIEEDAFSSVFSSSFSVSLKKKRKRKLNNAVFNSA